MAEQRTKEQINQDYGQVCAQIGERTFQIAVMQSEIEELKKKVVSLGQEMQALSKPAEVVSEAKQ